MVYLDWAATAKPDEQSLDEAREAALKYFGNPSSPHAAGRQAEKMLAQCRATVSGALSCDPAEIVFTSGGTESNNMVVFSLVRKYQPEKLSRVRTKIIVSAIEHASVYEPALSLQRLGFETVEVRPNESGLVEAESVAAALDEQTVMVLLMLVNNETGAIQPLADVVRCVREFSETTGREIHVHTDAVQGLGKIPFEPKSLGVDTASMSAHKIGAPRGVGALFVRSGIPLEAAYVGGGQESDRRPGTENLPGICGFAGAVRRHVHDLDNLRENAAALVDRLVSGISGLPGARLLPSTRMGAGCDRYSPFIVSVAFPPIPGEVLVRVLDEEEVLVSTGSACSSRRAKRTRALESMGVAPDIARSAIRVSFGSDTVPEHVDKLLAAINRRVPPMVKIFR